MKLDEIKILMESFHRLTVSVFGDFCLDAYWIMEPAGGETSVETGIRSRAVSKHYYTLGGASNIVANLAALTPGHIRVFGAVGNDIFGRELIRRLNDLKVDTRGMLVQPQQYDTVVFGKPYSEGKEEARIDFGFFNRKSSEIWEAQLAGLAEAFETSDAVIFNQQVPGSLDDEEYVKRINTLFERHKDRIILLDSRHYNHRFSNVMYKINAVEAARLCGNSTDYNSIIPLEQIKSYARTLHQKTARPVFITRGQRGILVCDADGIHEVPGIQISNKIDPVGCGDTTVAVLALCLAAGAAPSAAAEIANVAASITARKLYQTGTPSAREILETAADADCIYQPELADDRRQAAFLPGADIEVCYPRPQIPSGRIKHAVFDHDGTISTLRQGWENIMEPVMIKAILGDRYATADETVYHRVRTRVLDYIDQSTGIETFKQMQTLVEMVREFNLVPADIIRDKWGYKTIYNNALMERVNDRIERFKNGQRDIHDFTIKRAVDFLNVLKSRGVRLYLASGTDHDDVLNEAEVLGYADLFEGGIYGARGEDIRFSKKKVIERIMREHNLHGSELLVVGDGPVEIREARKRRGLALGVASDEVRRYGCNAEKRSRLIKAGAHFIIPDFSQLDAITRLLFGGWEHLA